MSILSHFLKSSGFYFLGNVLSKLVMFLLLPVYTSYIKPESLGYFDVSYTYLNLITTFLFVDIYVGIMRFVFDSPTASNVKKPILNGLIIFSVSFILYSILAVFLWLRFDIEYIEYIYIYGACLTVNNLLGYLARALGHNKLFAMSGVISTLTISLLNVVGIVVVKGGIEVLYISSIIGLLVQIVLLERVVRVRDCISFSLFDKELLRKLFHFSIPLSLNSLAFWLLTGYTNVAISYLLDLEANGIYMVAAKFGVAITLLSTCFNLAWQEVAFKKGNENSDELGRFYSGAINMLIKFFGLGAVCLIPVSYLLFPFVVKGEYVSSLNLIPLYVIVAVFSVISAFLGQIYAAIKATKEIMYSTMTACFLNLILVPLFIFKFELIGAMVGMLLSYFVNVCMRIIILRRYVRIIIDYKYLLILLPLVIMAFAVFYLGDTWANLILCISFSAISIFLFRDMLKLIVQNVRMKK